MQRESPTADEAVPLDDERAIERLLTRRRQLRRRVLGGAVVLLAAIWALWAWDSSRMLENTAASSFRPGDPRTLQDLHGVARGGDNAVDEIVAAGAAIRLTPIQEDIVSGASRRGPMLLPFARKTATEALDAEAANRAVTEHLRRAVSRPGASCDVPTFALLSQHGRRLFDFLRISAIAAKQGDDTRPPRHGDAVAYVLDALRLAEAIDRCGTTRTRIMATGWYTVVTDLIIEVSPDLSITEDGAGGTASRAEVRALMQALLDERIPQAAARDAVLDEQLTVLSYVRANNPGGPFLSPAYQRDAAYTLKACAQAREALSEATWPRMLAALPQDRAEYYDYVMAPSRSLFQSTVRRTAMWHVRSLVDRRAGATRLALRLYEVEFARLPLRLEELVPHCIPSLPVDIFDSESRPLRYALDEGPRLFSVGADLTDSGWGWAGGRRRGMGPRSYRWRESGSVYPLGRPVWRLQPENPAPATGP